MKREHIRPGIHPQPTGANTVHKTVLGDVSSQKAMVIASYLFTLITLSTYRYYTACSPLREPSQDPT